MPAFRTEDGTAYNSPNVAELSEHCIDVILGHMLVFVLLKKPMDLEDPSDNFIQTHVPIRNKQQP
jgi:hypothetical protein